MKKNITERQETIDHAAGTIAPLAPKSVDHLGNPRAAKDRRKNSGSHDKPDIRLGTTMAHDENGKEEKAAQTGYRKKVGSG